MLYQYQSHPEQNPRDLKQTLRAFIYLDCLTTFYKWTPQITMTSEELQQKLRLPQGVIESILEKFTVIS